MKNQQRIAYIARIGVLSAIAVIVMQFDFPLWFAPNFYKLDFSEVVVLIGTFVMGPVAGILIELIKNLLKVLVLSSNTAYVGEFANFVTGCAFVVPAALFYQHKKTRKNAIIGMAIGTCSLIVVGGLMNYFVLIPAFSNLYHMPMETIIAMGTSINSAITNLPTLIVFAVAPFNLVKGILTGIITFFLYKPLAPLLKGKVQS